MVQWAEALLMMVSEPLRSKPDQESGM